MIKEMKKHLIEYEDEFCNFIMRIFRENININAAYTDEKIAVSIDENLRFGYYSYYGSYVFMDQDEYELSRFIPFHTEFDVDAIDYFIYDQKKKDSFFDFIRMHPDLKRFKEDLIEEMGETKYKETLNSLDFIHLAASYFEDELNQCFYSMFCDFDYAIVEEMENNIFEVYKSDLKNNAKEIWGEGVSKLNRLEEEYDEI